MSGRFIGSGFSDRLSSPVGTKVKCCRSCEDFGCPATDCSATRIPFSTDCLVVSEDEDLTPLLRCSWRILQSQSTELGVWMCRYLSICISASHQTGIDTRSFYSGVLERSGRAQAEARALPDLCYKMSQMSLLDLDSFDILRESTTCVCT